MKKPLLTLILGSILAWGDHFIEVPKSSFTKKELTPLDKRLKELRSANDADTGYIINARTQSVIGAPSASLPKKSIQKNLTKKPKEPQKDAITPNKSVDLEKIPLL